MRTKPAEAVVVGLGAAACIACCAGPIGAALAAVGISGAAGYTAFGVVGLLLAAASAAAFLVRRRRRAVACAPAAPETAVSLSATRPAPPR